MELIVECVIIAIKAWAGSLFISLAAGLLFLSIATIVIALNKD